METERTPMNSQAAGWVYPDCRIHETAFLGPGVVVGMPPSPDDACAEYMSLPTVVGAGCYISPFVVLYQGAALEQDVFLDPFCRVGSNTRVGMGTRLLYGARVHNDVTIGSECIIGGSVPNGVVIGNHVTHMGRIAHTYNNPRSSWAETEEPSPVIEDFAVIGANALIIGPVTIGQNAYIAAGEVVRKSVPANCVVYKGRIYQADEWKGKLSRSGYFGEGTREPGR